MIVVFCLTFFVLIAVDHLTEKKILKISGFSKIFWFVCFGKREKKL